MAPRSLLSIITIGRHILNARDKMIVRDIRDNFLMQVQGFVSHLSLGGRGHAGAGGEGVEVGVEGVKMGMDGERRGMDGERGREGVKGS